MKIEITRKDFDNIDVWKRINIEIEDFLNEQYPISKFNVKVSK